MLDGSGPPIPQRELEDLQQRLEYPFTDVRLLVQALTHRTWLKERQDLGLSLDAQDQQRLEFLGDAFLGYVIGHRLYVQYPSADEGTLTSRRQALVEGEWLDQVGQRLDVDRAVLLGRGAASQLERNGRLRRDTMEALIGAVLLDGGERAARDFIERHIPALMPLEQEVDPIKAFAELYQDLYRHPPPDAEYEQEGEAHQPHWTATVRIEGQRFQGISARKQDARREACRAALPALRRLKSPF